MKRLRKKRPDLAAGKKKEGSFFPAVQKKLAVGQPGDAFEVEADKMADTVVNGAENGAVQKKGTEEEIQQKPLADSISSVHKKDLAVEEEPVQKAAEEEEAVQKQEEEEEAVQTTEEEEAVQKQEEEEAVQTMEEEEAVQNQEEEEAVQTMEEEEAVQNQEEEEAVQTMEEEEAVQKQEEEPVQAKSKKTKTSPLVETMLKKSKGKGQNLSGDILKEMNNKFGVDFSNIKIHTNDDAVKMCEELGAQAFTNENDIYFNAGKYNPDTATGKYLLAHELTHTVQQSK